MTVPVSKFFISKIFFWKTFVFKLKPFLLLNVLALIIFYSWINGSTRVYWEALDAWSFEVFNGSLFQSSYWWSGMWAILSVRIADIFPLFFILLFFYFNNVLFEKNHQVFQFQLNGEFFHHRLLLKISFHLS